MTQRQVAKELSVSPTAVSKALFELIETDLIIFEKVGKMNLSYMELNRNFDKVINLKRIENLRLIYSSGFFSKLREEFYGATIILFGSYSRGEDIFSSDVDIAVIGKKEKSLKFLEKYEELFRKKIIINFYPSFKNIHKNLKESILNGILLSGSVEL